MYQTREMMIWKFFDHLQEEINFLRELCVSDTQGNGNGNQQESIHGQGLTKEGKPDLRLKENEAAREAIGKKEAALAGAK